jgi:hypothetical protein
MNNVGAGLPFLEKHLGCYGLFNITDPLCRGLCALRLRCAIDHEQRQRIELLEDLIAAESFSERIQ